MKYIRTKEEIFTQERYEITKTFVGVLQDEQARIMPIEKTDFSIIKEADTIEELCDEFVIKWNSGEYIVYHELEWAKDKLNSVDDKEYTIYGAIWTDKGLIYVAKMNEKGELELI